MSKRSTKSRKKSASLLKRGQELPEPLRQQFFVIFGTSAALFAACVGLICFRWYYDRLLDPAWFVQNAVLFLSVTVSMFAPPAMLRQKSVHAPTAMLALAITMNCIVITINRGGFWGIPFVWMTLVPLLVTMLSGIRAGIVTAMIIGGIEVWFYVAQFSIGYEFPSNLNLESSRSGRYFGAVSGLAFITFFTWIYSYTYRRTAYQVSSIQTRANTMRERQRMKSEFVAMMSHELRTPLNAVIGFSRIIFRATEGRIDNETRSDFNEIRVLGEQLLSRIDDILDVERLESGMLTRSNYSLDINDLFQNLKEQAAHEGIRVRLSKKITDPLVVSDPDRLQRLLLHFVNQARAATPEINVYAEQVENAIIVAVDGRAASTAPDQYRDIDPRQRGDREFSLYMAHLLAKFVGAELILDDELPRLVIFREPRRSF